MVYNHIHVGQTMRVSPYSSLELTPSTERGMYTVKVLGEDWCIVCKYPSDIRLTRRLHNGELSFKTGTHFRNGAMLIVAEQHVLSHWTLSVEICDFTFAVVADWKRDDAERTLLDWIRTHIYSAYVPIYNEYPFHGTFNRKCLLTGPPIVIYSCLTPKPVST